MDEPLSLEKFSPAQADLQNLAAETAKLTLTDPFNKDEYKIVKEAKLNLVHTRTAINKTGKALREGAVKFQKDVLAKEKELLAIIEPEETRLENLIDSADKQIERQSRVDLLPHRKERLLAIKDDIVATDEELLDMEGPAFEGYLNQRQANKNEADRQVLAEAQRKIDEERDEIQHKKDLAAAEERGREQAKQELERQEKEKKDKEEQDEKDRQAKAEVDRLAAVEAEKTKPDAEKFIAFAAALESITMPDVSTEKYQKFVVEISSDLVKLSKKIKFFVQ